jgi:hypothetical protein
MARNKHAIAAMQAPSGAHFNINFEPSQASNNWTGPYVIGYYYTDGPHGKRLLQYRVTVEEKVYRQAVQRARYKAEPWKILYELFRPPSKEAEVTGNG